MKLDFSGLNSLVNENIRETQPRPTETPETDVFEACRNMLERYYRIDYNSVDEWKELIGQAESIYQGERMRAGGEIPEPSKEIIFETLSFLEKVSTWRHASAAKGGTD